MCGGGVGTDHEACRSGDAQLKPPPPPSPHPTKLGRNPPIEIPDGFGYSIDNLLIPSHYNGLVESVMIPHGGHGSDELGGVGGGED